MIVKKMKSFAQLIGFATLLILIVMGAISLLQKAERALAADPRLTAAAPVTDNAEISADGDIVPSYLTYQGTLRDAEGTPMSGVHRMVFRIYANVTDPTPDALWSEDHPEITVRDGQFSVLLGDLSPLAPEIFQNANRFIGITVDDKDEMVPRQRFAAVPYAMAAAGASYLTGPDGNPVRAVTVGDGGRVGIGVEDPQAQLHLQSGDQELRIDSNAIDSTGALAINGNSAQNVGFGTQVPLAQVHVVGAENNGTDASVKISGQAATLLLDSNEIDSTNHLWINGNKSTHVFLANGGGRVGIGISSGIPAARLDVNGDLNVRGDILNFKSRGPFIVTSVNGTSTGTKDMGSAEERMCFLTKVGMDNLLNDPAPAFCEVYIWQGRWNVKANTAAGFNTTVDCRAMCLEW